jgi:hypothetical protein
MVDLPTFPTSRQDTGEDRWGDYMGRVTNSGIVRGPYALSPNGDGKLYGDGVSGMVSKIGPFAGLVNGVMAESAGIVNVNHNPASGTQHRYDRVVLQLDTSSPYTGRPVVKQGSNAGSQSAAFAAMPALTSLEADIGYVYIAPGVSAISAGAVTPNRTWASAVGMGAWTNYACSIFPTSGSTHSIVSAIVTRARYRIIGSSCEVSVAASIALTSSGGGLLFALPVVAKFTAEPLTAVAFNNAAWAQTTTSGGVIAWADMYSPTDQIWPGDGVARNVGFRGSYEIAAAS